jgi:uncharacterized glyoxalase superfamily protein PhnB
MTLSRHVTRVFPILAVRDLSEAVDYYRDTLGFSMAWVWGDPAQRVGVTLDDIEIQLVAPGPGVPPGPGVVYCHMTGIDAYYEECKRAGAEIVLGLGERPWGARDFRVVDPSGNRIGFAELT